MADIRYAIKALLEEIYLDECLSKLLIVYPALPDDMIEKYKPFLLLGNNFYSEDSYNTLNGVNPLYNTTIIYS